MSSYHNPDPCKILIDAMGGDNAPLACINGAIQAQQSIENVDVFLIGKKQVLLDLISKQKLSFDSNKIIDASEVIEMDDKPAQAIKSKKDSSIVRGCELVKSKEFSAFVSAGNTGAMMAASTLIMGRLKGVSRTTMGSFMPSAGGITTVFDVGANVDCKPRFLVEFAMMGSIFVKEIYKIDNPKVGLLSVGEEDTKGNEVVLEAHKLLKMSKLNFIGNIEGRDILKGTANVVVCDGFVGNVVLKFGESLKVLLKHLLIEYASQSIFKKIKVGLLKSTLNKVLKSIDYQEYGGVPLLGVDGISIIGHGSSTPKAIKNMVVRAKEMHDKDIVNKIQKALSEIEIE